MDYYVVRGRNADEVVTVTAGLPAKHRSCPNGRWAFSLEPGALQNQDELCLSCEFRRQIPSHNIVQDWSYWEENAWGIMNLMRNAYNPEQMVRTSTPECPDNDFSLAKFYINTEHNRV